LGPNSQWLAVRLCLRRLLRLLDKAANVDVPDDKARLRQVAPDVRRCVLLQRNLGPYKDTTLSLAIPIKRPCRCVSVPPHVLWKAQSKTLVKDGGRDRYRNVPL
jgi:hypothetical protein